LGQDGQAQILNHKTDRKGGFPNGDVELSNGDVGENGDIKHVDTGGGFECVNPFVSLDVGGVDSDDEIPRLPDRDEHGNKVDKRGPEKERKRRDKRERERRAELDVDITARSSTNLNPNRVEKREMNLKRLEELE